VDFTVKRGMGSLGKTTRETIRKDLKINEWEKDMVFDIKY